MIDEKLILSHHTGLYDYIDAENIIEGKYLPSEINKNGTGIDKALLLEELRNSPFFKLGVDKKHFHPSDWILIISGWLGSRNME